ncbi:MAG: TMEM175 family protein [Dokdonella sp.]
MHKDSTSHALERLVFFSDAVFAIVITLLVLEIRTPELGSAASERQWLTAILELLPHFGAFMLSFLVIGALWMSHHRLFMMVRQYDERLLWPNLLLLLSVAFLPFTTSLLSTGSLAITPFAFYAASLLLASLLKARLARVALSPGVVDSHVSATLVRGEMRRRWVMPIAACVTLILAFVATPWNSLAMLLLPMLKRLPPFRDR